MGQRDAAHGLLALLAGRRGRGRLWCHGPSHPHRRRALVHRRCRHPRIAAQSGARSARRLSKRRLCGAPARPLRDRAARLLLHRERLGPAPRCNRQRRGLRRPFVGLALRCRCDRLPRPLDRGGEDPLLVVAASLGRHRVAHEPLRHELAPAADGGLEPHPARPTEPALAGRQARRHGGADDLRWPLALPRRHARRLEREWRLLARRPGVQPHRLGGRCRRAAAEPGCALAAQAAEPRRGGLEPRLLAGRGRRGAARRQQPLRPLPRREAPLLPRRPRPLHAADAAHLHPLHRPSALCCEGSYGMGIGSRRSHRCL